MPNSLHNLYYYSYRYHIHLYTVFFDPVLNPDGGDDGTIDVVEGSSLTLSCSGNPRNTGTGPFAKTYQWFDSAGNSVTESTPFPPNTLSLTAISRNDSGEYQCRYTLTSSGEITRSNVTINVQCEYISLLIKTLMLNFFPLFYRPTKYSLHYTRKHDCYSRKQTHI